MTCCLYLRQFLYRKYDRYLENCFDKDDFEYISLPDGLKKLERNYD